VLAHAFQHAQLNGKQEAAVVVLTAYRQPVLSPQRSATCGFPAKTAHFLQRHCSFRTRGKANENAVASPDTGQRV
jgi:hypothetical protein